MWPLTPRGHALVGFLKLSVLAFLILVAGGVEAGTIEFP